ncbi:MAG: prephenate dehydrogenase/arogenate dehydrogenase family protein [Acidobacteriota bacterium]
MDDFSHVTIIGCGLIGGSFALALRRAGFSGRITASGGSRGPHLALERGIIDAIELSFRNGERCDADLVYLASPIGAIIDFLRTSGNQIATGAIVTDAGSTKTEICRVAADSLPAGTHFVGGHPMAGSEHTGVEYARADLFDRATYALVGGAQASQRAFDRLVSLVTKIGARPLTVDAADHDRAVALISHLPQLLSSELSSLLAPESEEDEAPRDLAQRLAAGGWNDMTRLGASSWRVWRDIVLTNQPNISMALSELIAGLQVLEIALESRDFNQIRQVFEAANRSVGEQRARRYQHFDKV